MTRRLVTTRTDGYGVTVELRIEHADTITRQELARTLQLAATEALAAATPTPWT